MRSPGLPPAWGPAAVAAVPAKIVSAPSATSARADHTSVRSPPRERLADRLVSAGPPGERGGGGEDQHRQREVAHHPAVVELAAHGEPAEHGLGDHAEG